MMVGAEWKVGGWSRSSVTCIVRERCRREPGVEVMKVQILYTSVRLDLGQF